MRDSTSILHVQDIDLRRIDIQAGIVGTLNSCIHIVFQNTEKKVFFQWSGNSSSRLKNDNNLQEDNGNSLQIGRS